MDKIGEINAFLQQTSKSAPTSRETLERLARIAEVE